MKRILFSLCAVLVCAGLTFAGTGTSSGHGHSGGSHGHSGRYGGGYHHGGANCYRGGGYGYGGGYTPYYYNAAALYQYRMIQLQQYMNFLVMWLVPACFRCLSLCQKQNVEGVQCIETTRESYSVFPCLPPFQREVCSYVRVNPPH